MNIKSKFIKLYENDIFFYTLVVLLMAAMATKWVMPITIAVIANGIIVLGQTINKLLGWTK